LRVSVDAFLNNVSLRSVCEFLIVSRRPLINMERSGMLINVLQLPRSACFSFTPRVELLVIG